MKVLGFILATSSLLGLTDALPAEHFTITALGDLVPSGYTGYQYSVRFLIRDRLDSKVLTQCGHTWAKQNNFPSNYIKCDDPNWRWRYIGQYRECGFSMGLSHSKIETDGEYKYNTTSEATLSPNQVPCAIGASRNFTCIYGTTGAQLCGLGQGTILQVPVRKRTSQTTKIAKAPAKKQIVAARAAGARGDGEGVVEESEVEIDESVVESDIPVDDA